MDEVLDLQQMGSSHLKRKWLDVPYADHSNAQKLDIYIPTAGKEPYPVIVVLHGGGWLYGDKKEYLQFPFLEALDRDYAVVCVNYRLSDEGKFPHQIYDCKAAIRYIRANAKKYHLDGDHIGVWGASAGGYLAALLGTSANFKGLEDSSIRNSNNRTYPNVQAAVIWHAPIESFLTMDEQLAKSGLGIPNHSTPDSPESKLLGRRITDIPAMVKFASPMTYIDLDTPAFLIQHGLQDEVIPVEQSIHFAAELERIAGSSKVALEIFEDARHADPVFETSQNIQRVLDFFDIHLKDNQNSIASQRARVFHYAINDAPPPADTSHIKRKYLNIPYAHYSPAQKLDLYLPKRKRGPFPVIMAFHGGAFMGGDKADLHVLPMLEGLKRGYAVISVNYRLSKEAKFPAQVQDAKAAVRWIRGNAAQYRLDPNRIAAWGSLAGGYLSIMLGTSAGVSELEDLSLGNPNQSCDVQAVVSWYGPTDFLKMDEYLKDRGMLPPPGFRHSEANSPESLLLGQALAAIPEKVKAANPETYIRPNAPPFLLQHGTKDPIVPVQQSVELAKKLKHALGKEQVILELFDGGEHANELFAASENVTRVLDFLDLCLK